MSFDIVHLVADALHAHAWIGVAAVLGASRGMLAVACCHQRVCRPPAEASRKLLHVGMGTICMAWPWLFRTQAPAAILAVIYAGLLLARRIVPTLDAHVAGVIYGVDRSSKGEFWFPLSAWLLFVLARGDWLLFCAPLALLTYADAAAAVIGTRYGRTPLVRGKSVEGCLACCVTAFVTTHVLLSLDGRASSVDAVLVAMVVAVVTAVLEAGSPAGLDNLSVPLVGSALLRALPHLSLGALFVALVACGVGVVAIFCFRATRQVGRVRPAPYSSGLASG